MKTRIVLILSTFLLTLTCFAGEPVPGAEVYIEQEGNGNEGPIAFQETGNTGQATFSHLDAGKYKVYMVFPKQKGKLAIQRKVKCNVKAAYDIDKKTYYLQQPEGYFSVHFSGLKKISGKGFVDAYDAEKNPSGRILLGEFMVSNDNGSISLAIEAETAKKFAKTTNVIKNRTDTAKNSIRNIN